MSSIQRIFGIVLVTVGVGAAMWVGYTEWLATPAADRVQVSTVLAEELEAGQPRELILKLHNGNGFGIRLVGMSQC